MLRAVFMGTPAFAVGSLEALASAPSEIEVVGVYTQPDRPVGRGMQMQASAVKTAALALGLSVYQPEKLSASGEFEKLAVLKPDVILVVAYGQILRRNVLDLPRFGCVNVHASLLPRWRGAAPIQSAILARDPKTGVCTMKLVEALDAGDVLLRAETPIEKNDTTSTLFERLSRMGAELVLPTMRGLRDGTIQPQKQDDSQVTLAKKLTKEMEWLDPQLAAAELDARVRALNPWPGSSLWVHYGGDRGSARLKVKRAEIVPSIRVGVGQLALSAGVLVLGTPQGALRLIEVQEEGKKSVDASVFLHGLQGRGIALPLQVGLPQA